MAAKKSRFTFLEFATGALPDAFSAQVLSQVPNERDEDDPEDKDDLLRKKLQTLMGTTQVNPDEQPDDNDARLFKILKGFLTHDEGDGGAGDEEGPHDDSPSGVDHDEYKDIDPRLDKSDVGPFPLNDDPTDQPHPGEIADEKYADEKHEQLLAAISDLRDELRNMKTGESQPQSKWKISRMGSEENEESYEEDEQDNTKQAKARQMFSTLINQGVARQDIIDRFMKNIGVTQSTATSYYQRLAKEAGLTTSGDREMPGQGEPPGLGTAAGVNPQIAVGGQSQANQQNMEMPEEPESNISGIEVEGDPDKQGLIRTVKGAHLVYKRKNEEGSYDELWVFGVENNDIRDSLEVRRAIIAGTDIPPRALKSEDGRQSYTLTTLGNGQLLHIKGLPN